MAVIDRIKFDWKSDDVFVEKYRDEQGHSDEIRIGAQLIVNQSQEVVFFKGGQALDVFGPGTHTLATDNIPLLRKLVNLPFGGSTPFTAEVWCVSKTAKRDLGWGTKSPIPVIDALYGIPVSIRAFGKWGFRIRDSRSFVTQLVGTRIEFGKPNAGNPLKTDAAVIKEYFVGEIVQRVVTRIAQLLDGQKLSIFQVSARISDLSSAVAGDLRGEFSRFGLEIVNFNVESINIPDEEKKRIQDVTGQRLEMDQISQANTGPAYTTKRTFDVLEKAAQNEGGGAGALMSSGLGLGLGVGAGFPIGKQIGDALQSPGATPTDVPGRLATLKELLDKNLITQAEYEATKAKILNSI